MVTRTITILQHMLQNCYCACVHFTLSGVKVLRSPYLIHQVRRASTVDSKLNENDIHMNTSYRAISSTFKCFNATYL